MGEEAREQLEAFIPDGDVSRLADELPARIQKDLVPSVRVTGQDSHRPHRMSGHVSGAHELLVLSAQLFCGKRPHSRVGILGESKKNRAQRPRVSALGA